jgi:hypothetical protein
VPFATPASNERADLGRAGANEVMKELIARSL